MHKTEKTSYSKIQGLLKLSSKSRDDFLKAFKQLGQSGGLQVYTQMLFEMEKAVIGGDSGNFKAIGEAVELIISGAHADTLANYCGLLRDANFFVLACKHNSLETVRYLLGNKDQISQDTALGKMDYEGHNATYYAIRSGNVELLETVIGRRPCGYLAYNLEEIEQALSAAYNELKLRNVPLSDEIELFVQKKLLNLRFFSRVEKAKTSPSNIVERIQLVLEKIRALRAESSLTEIDSKFVYIATFVADNIHMLKQQLKSTYDILPWEEIEFCLVSFISAHTKPQEELNLFTRSVLNKGSILEYLDHFSKLLESLTKYIKSANVSSLRKSVSPNLNRNEVIANILNQNNGFCSLYSSYQEIRDVYSMQIMKRYIDAALLAECNTREGQLTVKRALQVMGEHLKNTVYSPKLSEGMSQLLLLSAPRETRDILKKLRNSLSHAHFILVKEAKEECKLYTNIQNDINKVGIVIRYLLFSKRIENIKSFLTKIIGSNSLDEVNEILEAFQDMSLDLLKSSHENRIPRGNQRVVELINEIDNLVKKTSYENGIFKQIIEVIHKSDNNSIVSLDEYITGFIVLSSMSRDFLNSKNQNKWTEISILKVKKYTAKKMLVTFSANTSPLEIKNKTLLSSLLFKFHDSVMPRVSSEIADRLNFLICLVNYVNANDNDNLMWIDEFRERLSKYESNKSSVKDNCNKKLHHCIPEDQLAPQLEQNLSDLRDIINVIGLGDKSSKNKSATANNHKTKFMMEMIILDVLSFLDSSNHLTNNELFLDDNAPLLSGRCLRNHLAHGNALFDLLYPDIFLTLLSNAKSLTENVIINVKRKIGNIVIHDIDKVQLKYDRGLQIISQQEEMTAALREGNLQDLKRYLKEGADTTSKSFLLMTSFHMAVRGPNLEVIKFLTERNDKTNFDERNITGQVPLHMAATFGRADTVEFLIKEIVSPIDVIDNVGKTPLHLAAQNGHQETVEKLLSLGASHTIKDFGGNSPVHCAVSANHVNVAKVLLEKDANVDTNEIVNGFTCLHVAAEFGNVELVHYLLHKNADVNAKTLRGARPIHLAALNGHLNVVNALINKGAQVNPVSSENGCTPLHYAVENSHEDIVEILLNHDAFVNIGDYQYNHTPLHWAASNGHIKIVKLLIKYKANVNTVKYDGTTPLLCAAAAGHLEIVELLIQNGSLKDSRDGNGWTALHLSIMQGHNDIVKSLVEKGFNIHIGDKRGLTPLHLAAKFDNQPAVEILLAEGADVKSASEDGSTPLHFSACNGNEAVSEVLIKMQALVNAVNKNKFTPLHEAVSRPDNEKIINLLIKHGADVNIKGWCNTAPLHVASTMGHSEAVDILIKNNAIVDVKTNIGDTALHLAAYGNHNAVVDILVKHCSFTSKDVSAVLCLAIRNNYGDLVKTLIARGADVNINDGEPLKLAISAGHRSIAEALLKNKNMNIDVKDQNGFTLLHTAAVNGNLNIGKALIKKGIEVNSETFEKVTSLSVAILRGNNEFVDMLLASGADVNVILPENNSLLHIAIMRDNPEIVETLLSWGAKYNIRDVKNRTPLELAVANSKLRIVKVFFQHCDINVNERGNDNWTLLHIAAQTGNLESVEFLKRRGADVGAKNSLGSKPVHIAAREGFVKIVEFFLKCGVSIDDKGAAGDTLMHYSAMSGQVEVVQYLIGKCADINAIDQNGMQPIHLAAKHGQLEVLNILVQSGAIYDNKDRNKNKPAHLTKNKDISKVLESIENIFKAVKGNNVPCIEGLINDGAPVNAMSADKSTLLHLVCWKGYERACDILLKNKANPNVIGKGGNVPLHYAANFSHLKIVQSLLKHSAKYNVITDNGKIPLDFATEESIVCLLKLVDRSFRKVQCGDLGIINDLKKLNKQDVDSIKAVMKARNRDGKSLVVVAVNNDFPKVDMLKQILQEDVCLSLAMVEVMLINEHFTEALCMLEKVLDERREILGDDNPGTLDVLEKIATTLYKQSKYSEALKLNEDIYQKLLELLGPHNVDSLRVRSGIALILHRQGKDQEAVNIFQDVYKKQKEVLSEDHLDVLKTRMHMALSLDALGKYDEALSMNRENYERSIKIFGAKDPSTLSAHNNIAMVLNKMGRHDDAFVIYQEVYETRKIVLGPNHSDTLRAKHNMAYALVGQKKSDQAMKVFQEVLAIQKNVLGPEDNDTLITQTNIGALSLSQNKVVDAVRAFKAGADQWKTILGTGHLRNEAIDKLIKGFDKSAKIAELDIDRIQSCQLDVITAASEGDITVLENLIQNGSDVDTADAEGTTPLHFAASEGHTGIVRVLLKRGADATAVTGKGNTPLHIAASRDHVEIAKLLLQNVTESKQIRFNDFLNAKTVVGGTSALHVACKKGSIQMVKCLLKYGACYNPADRAYGSTPLQYSQSPDVTRLLQLTRELFVCAEKGDSRIVKKLLAMETDSSIAVLNARDEHVRTPLQVALVNQHKTMASSLGLILKDKK